MTAAFAMSAPEVGQDVAERSGSGWLREEDLDAFEEDVERNAEQSVRNARMREMLAARKRKRDAAEEASPPAQVLPEEFMEVSAGPKATKDGDDSLPPWFVMRPHIDNVVLRLHEELLDFVAFMKHTREEVKARRAWVRTIGDVCQDLWPDCKVRVFGSFHTGLSLPNADVDVAVLDVPCSPGTAMKILAEHLLARGKISWLEIIESAKVPIIKVRSQASGLRADVVFNKPDGLETSKFVVDRMKEYPQMKPLLVFLKYFLLQRGLHETYTGGMGSYLLCSVVLHFLQRHPSARDPKTYAATTLGHLLFDLLKYYGQEFNYDMAISVLDGGRTFRREERGKGKGKGKSKKGGISLCLESPGDPSIDLGGACFRMPVLRNLFHHGFHCLCHLFVSKAPAEGSLLCPLLLDPTHLVITNRHKLMVEQPVALASLRRPADVSQDVPAEEERPAKRARHADDRGDPDAALAEEDDEKEELGDGDLAPADDADGASLWIED